MEEFWREPPGHCDTGSSRTRRKLPRHKNWKGGRLIIEVLLLILWTVVVGVESKGS